MTGSPVIMTEHEAATLLIAAMDQQGMHDNDMRAGTAAIAMGESLMTPHTETPYTHTADSRVRQVFGSRVASLSDGELDALKANPEAFFNLVYGGAWGAKNLGNTEIGDGYKYRGRTMLQLTGRANYAELAKRTRIDIIGNPDLTNDPQTSAAIAVAYMLWRYHGGGFDKMLAAVGNNTEDIRATKERYYAQFTASGEFDYRSGPAPATATAAPAAPTPAPAAQTVLAATSVPDALKALRAAVQAAPDGAKQLQAAVGAAPDGMIGSLTAAALAKYLAASSVLLMMSFAGYARAADLVVAPAATESQVWFGNALTGVLTLCVPTVAAILCAMLWKLAAKFGIQVDAAQQAKLTTEATTALTQAIAAPTTAQMIRNLGWDHVDVHNKVIADALNFFLQRFPDRATAIATVAGVASPALASPAKEGAVVQTLLARLPDAVLQAAQSPATPPASLAMPQAG